MVQRRMRATFVMAMIVLLGLAPAAFANECSLEQGIFVSRTIVGPRCDGVLCAKGFVLGTLRGVYQFTLTQNNGLPPVIPFVGESHFRTADGEFFGTDAGTMNLITGELVAETTILADSGTGKFTGASGVIVISGIADFSSGSVRGTYGGEICVP